MIVENVSAISCPPIFFKLNNFLSDSEAYVKLEGLNIAGSIKLTTAKKLIESLEKKKIINSKTKIVESSSGNLGVALSLICKEKGYHFICVTDPNILPENEKLMNIYGAEIIKITERDVNGGYLSSRIAYIQQILENNPDYIWLNQYANPSNPSAHFSQTAADIYQSFTDLDYLFVGAGTTGTLMGCAAYFRKNSPRTKIIGVDSEGSVTFGFHPKKRHIPGIGTSKRPEIVNEDLLDEILLIEELDAVNMCHWLLETYGLFLGGSSGTVLQAIKTYENKIPPKSRVMAISPDFGNKYMDMIYDNQWVQEKFGL